MRRPIILLALLVPVLFGYSISNANAFIRCQIQINYVDSPPTVALEETFNVKTSLTVTCNTSTVDISGRVDVNDVAANRTLSTTGIHVGFIAEPEKTVNFTSANPVKAPATATAWRLRVHVFLIANQGIVGEANRDITIQVGQTIQSTSTAATTSERATASTTEYVASSTAQAVVGSTNSTNSTAVVAVALLAIVLLSGFLILKRKRFGAVSVQQEAALTDAIAKRPGETPVAPVVSFHTSLSTGYSDLDGVLSGGIPIGYSILIESLPCDEKDLLLRRIIESGLARGFPVFFVSHNIGLSSDLARRYPANFHVFCVQAEKISSPAPNIYKIEGERNLNDLNITLDKAMRAVGSRGPSSIMILDVLSDVLLEHGAVTARKWLEDFFARRRSEGFTVVTTLNPNIASRQQIETLLDLFEGIMEIYEKEIREKSRRFLTVKKMYGLKYREDEILLDKDRLY